MVSSGSFLGPSGTVAGQPEAGLGLGSWPPLLPPPPKVLAEGASARWWVGMLGMLACRHGG